MPLTTYTRQKAGDHITGKTTWTKPTLYASLYSSSPGAAGSQAGEVTQFARIEVTSKLSAVDASGFATTTVELNWGVPVSDASAIAYIVLHDALTVGNVICYELLPDTRPVVNGGRAIRIAAGRLKMQFI